MSLAGNDIKAALHTLFTGTLYPTALVCYGPPGSSIEDTVISIGDQVLTFEPGPMTPTRPREEVVETELIFTQFIAGDVDAQKDATDAVYALAATLAEHLRTKPNETLGGVVRETRLTRGALVEGKAKPRTGGVAGRVSALSITLTCRARRP